MNDINVNKKDVYAVDELLKKRLFRGKVQYLVKWANFAEEYNTWEPENNILDVALLKSFEAKRNSELNFTNGHEQSTKHDHNSTGTTAEKRRNDKDVAKPKENKKRFIDVDESTQELRIKIDPTSELDTIPDKSEGSPPKDLSMQVPDAAKRVNVYPSSTLHKNVPVKEVTVDKKTAV